MVSGLHHLHTSNVVHGDIKGHNILLGPHLRPLFCDFGISKLQEDGTTSTNSRNAGSTKHMSPEILVEGASKNFASDIYAFGVTIFEVGPNLPKPMTGHLTKYSLLRSCQQQPRSSHWEGA